jgi:hypothetical protein
MRKGMSESNGIYGKYARQFRLLAAAVISLVAGTAVAFEIPTGSEDVVLRWDNTLRYTLSQRVDSTEKAYLASPNNDDGDRNFASGIVSNRLDLLSEADLVYKKYYGLRLSGSAWFDQAYDDVSNSSVITSNTLRNGQPANGLNDDSEDYFRGPHGELLDAFVFGKFDIGGVPLNLKAGRHTIYWGESLGVGGLTHGIAYAQMPIDIGKAFAMPGVEAKEVFRPLNNISFQAQPTDTLSIAGQYYLQWEENRFAGAGTYLAGSDVQLNGDDGSLIAGFDPAVGYLRATKGSNIEPDQTGDWGVAVRWSPEALAGTLGLYYRNFSDKFPQLHLQPGVIPGVGVVDPSVLDPAHGIIGKYHLAYSQDIDLYGISLSKQILGISVGTELSYRENMPLVSDPVTILPAALVPAVPGAISGLPDEGQTGGARGTTWHGLINFLGIISETSLFDSAAWNMEFVWNHLDQVTRGAAVYKGRSGYSGIDKPTDDYFGGALGFTPTWYQVFPGVDMTMPLSISSGLSGNSCVAAGGNKNTGTWGVGIGADIFSRYKVDLKYVDFFGDYSTTATGAVSIANGSSALLTDRGFVTLTLKASF